MNTLIRPVRILLVEDNPADVRLTQEALRETNGNSVLHVVGDGEAAMDFLYKRGHYSDVETPDLVLLDLNLPKMGGREVLAEVKGDPTLRRIPVVVLTTSSADEDILKSYDLHANCYISKPVDMDRFIEIMQTINMFWLTIAALPGAA